MPDIRILLALGVAAGGVLLLLWLSPARSKLEVGGDDLRFPVVSGANLKRQQMEFPRDFGRDYNLVFVPFQQHQQTTVNSWIPFAQELETEFDRFMYYEFPTIRGMSALSRTFINEGMRAGIPDPVSRERTITLYLDKESFKNDLGIKTEGDISLFLVDREGRILWRGMGEYQPAKGRELQQILSDLVQKQAQ
jgi:hypothetical protein